MHGPQRTTFLHRRFAVIDASRCVGCGRCADVCPLGTVLVLDEGAGKAVVRAPFACAGCCKCVERCPSRAIEAVELPVYRDSTTIKGDTMCFRPAAPSVDRTCPQCGASCAAAAGACPACGAALPASPAPGVPGAPGTPGAPGAPGMPKAPGAPMTSRAPGAPAAPGMAAAVPKAPGA